MNNRLLFSFLFTCINCTSFSQSWTALDGGLGMGNTFALAFDQSGSLYATGADINNKASVFKWSGSAWSMVGEGTHALNGSPFIRTMVLDKMNNIYVAGDFSNTNNYYYVAKWDGADWTELGGPNELKGQSVILSMVIDSSNTIYTGSRAPDGKWYVYQWDGSHWTTLGASADVSITSLALDPSGTLYAAGFFQYMPGPGSLFNVGKWDGSNWTAVGTGSFALNANSVISAMATDLQGNLYAAGYFTDGATSSSGNYYVAKWDGTNWSTVGTGIHSLSVNGPIHELTVDKNGNIYVGGAFKDGTNHNYIAKWDGTNWTALGTGIHALNANSAIWCIAVAPSGKLYASGNFTNADNQNYVAEWNSSSTAVASKQNGISLQLYPNPSSGEVKIDLLEDTHIDIYNASGIFMGSKEIKKETNTIDLSFLERGLFLLVFNGQQYKYHSLKWIKE